MSTMTTSEARDRFADVVRRAAVDKERVVLTDEDGERAAVVPIEDVQLLREIEDRQDLEDARRARAEAERDGTIPWETVKREVGL